MKPTSLEEFYKETAAATKRPLETLLPEGIHKEIGHFNVFSLEDIIAKLKQDPAHMPYNRREYYKISLVIGRNVAEYADKVIQIEKSALLFATPKIPYHWVPQDMDQKGHFCIFTGEFLTASKSGVVLDELPIFKPGGYPVFELGKEQAKELKSIFEKMHKEIVSNYLYKYDLLRNYVIELIHFGQKLQPLTTYNTSHNAGARVSSLFIELLERQFPIAGQQQSIALRTARDYADRLSVHVNHLNKVLKENTGRTTTEHISARIAREAKLLLMQTDWNVSEIAYSLGFDLLSHFSRFFKKQAGLSPLEFREQRS